MGVRIDTLGAAEAAARLGELIFLLQDAVQDGASLGFLAPLATSEATEYWDSVIRAVGLGSRLLLVACDAGDGRLIGTAQLALESRPNGRHRAEVAKVIVLREARRQGIGRALLLATEEHARRLGRSTLVLDTRCGDPSERLYLSVGYRLAGVIPRYARSSDGALDASAFYYRLLEGDDRDSR
jgi:acetyltransferase